MDAPGGMTHNALDNGLSVLADCMPGTGVFSIVLSMEAGSRYDVDERAGLASLSAGLMLEGTRRQSGRELALRVDSAGASLDVSVGYETCEIALTGLSDRLEQCLRVLSDIVLEPRLERGGLEVARRKQLAEIAEDEDDPFTVARHAFLDLTYGSHPRHRPVNGWQETVAAVDLADIASFRQSLCVPGSAVLAAAGDVDPVLLTELAGAALSDWSGASPDVASPAAPAGAAGSRRFVRTDRKQSHIMVGGLGVARSDPSYHAVSLMDVVLGDSAGFGSRLGRRLREGEGLAYVVESDASSTSGIDPGVVWFYTATSPGRAGRALEVLREELEILRTRPPSSDEVERARAYLVGGRRRAAESCEARAARLVTAERYLLGRDYEQRYPSILESVSVRDIQEIASRLLDPARHSTVVVGPESPWD